MILGEDGESVPLFAWVLRRFDLYRSSVYGIIFFIGDNTGHIIDCCPVEITAGQLENAKPGEVWNGYKQHEEKNAPDTGAVI